MIIGVQGTSKKKNNYIGITSLLASITSINCNAKTVVIQMQNPTFSPVDEKLDCELVQNEQSKTYTFEQNGIDFLLKEAEQTTLQRGLIESKSKSYVATKEESILNIVDRSKQKEFEETTDDISAIKKLLERADEDFEYVFVVLPREEALKKEVLKFCNYNIICVPQGNKVNVVRFADVDLSKSPNEGQKDIYVIADFDENSKFTVHSLGKAYGTKCIYPCLHNAEYKDAYLSGKVLDFVRSNISVSEEENNYQFILQLKTLIGEYATDTREDNFINNMLVADKLRINAFKGEADAKEFDAVSENFKVVKKKKFLHKPTEDVIISDNSEEGANVENKYLS